MNRTANNLAHQAARFSFAGIANTLVTVCVYQGLLFLSSAEVAYTLSWLLGFMIVVSLYPKHVFGKRDGLSKAKRLMIAFVYAASFFIGVCLIYLCNLSGIWERISIFISIAATTAFNFLAMRYIVAKN